MNTANSRKLEGRNGKFLSVPKVVQYHLKLDCDRLKKCNVNLKATTKIKPQRVIPNKPPKLLKY